MRPVPVLVRSDSFSVREPDSVAVLSSVAVSGNASSSFTGAGAGLLVCRSIGSGKETGDGEKGRGISMLKSIVTVFAAGTENAARPPTAAIKAPWIVSDRNAARR